MSPRALSQIGILFAVVLVGHLLIKAAGLDLPRSKSVSESFWRMFWIFRPDIPREQIRKSLLAYFLVAIVAYCVILIYRANLEFPP